MVVAGMGMPGMGGSPEPGGSVLEVAVGSCIEVGHEDQQDPEVGRGHRKAWAGLLHECKVVVHFDRDDYQTDQQQEPWHQDRKRQMPEQRRPGKTLDGTSIAD